jgi:hypothetical protein
MDETPAPKLDPKAGKTRTGNLWAEARDDGGWGRGEPAAIVLTYTMNILTVFEAFSGWMDIL